MPAATAATGRPSSRHVETGDTTAPATGEAALVEGYRRGGSLRALARAAGVSRNKVRRVLADAGVVLRVPVRAPRDPRWWSQRLDHGWGVDDFATELGMSTMTVYRWLARLQLRQPGSVTLDGVITARSRQVGGCLCWHGPRSSAGYPTVYRDGRRHLARRLLWEHHHGRVEAGHVVVTVPSCRHPDDCVELTHLRMIDTRTRATELQHDHAYAHGERHWNARLSEHQAREIRRSGETPTTTARRYNVSPATVRAIRAGRRWRHLSE